MWGEEGDDVTRAWQVLVSRDRTAKNSSRIKWLPRVRKIISRRLPDRIRRCMMQCDCV